MAAVGPRKSKRFAPDGTAAEDVDPTPDEVSLGGGDDASGARRRAARKFLFRQRDGGKGERSIEQFCVSALRCRGLVAGACGLSYVSPRGTHPLTICRLMHAPPTKRPHFPNPP